MGLEDMHGIISVKDLTKIPEDRIYCAVRAAHHALTEDARTKYRWNDSFVSDPLRVFD